MLSDSDLKILHDALHYMHMTELKEICQRFELSLAGKKGEIIQRIYAFCECGTILTSPKIPAVSLAKKHASYPLDPKTLILKGAYKNDAATREFMKTLVGVHFHFTAFGQDWIKQCWLSGKPPTYQEFADFWQQEYTRRKQERPQPKQEWAYLNFIQRNHELSNSSAAEIARKWEEERLRQCEKATSILQKVA